MKKLFIVLLVVIPLFTYSQENPSETSDAQTSMFDLRRNAVYNEDILSFSYERLLPVSEIFGFLLKGGFMIWNPISPLAEFGIISGGSKHFFEAGIGALLLDTSDKEGFDFLTFRAGYRYQAPKGFLFKASAIYSPDNFILPLIAVGYSF